MQLTISGHHVDITEAMRQYIIDKIPRLERHFDKISSLTVTLSLDHDYQHKAEAKIHLKGHDIFATSTQTDMYKSIDLLTDKLDRQLRKHKNRLVSRQHAS